MVKQKQTKDLLGIKLYQTEFTNLEWVRNKDSIDWLYGNGWKEFDIKSLGEKQ